MVKADIGAPLAIVGSPAVSAGFEALITACQEALQDSPLSDPDKAERVRCLIENLRDDLRKAMRADLGADP